jgi:hypothetical protein
MLNPTEFTSAVDHVNKIIKITIKAFPGVSHAEIATKALETWSEKRDGLEDALTKLRARKKAGVSTLASINTKQDQLDGLAEIEPILDAMLELLKKQGKPAAVKMESKAA